MAAKLTGCKRCGAPRFEGVNVRLCEPHYREYVAEYNRRTRAAAAERAKAAPVPTLADIYALWGTTGAQRWVTPTVWLMVDGKPLRVVGLNALSSHLVLVLLLDKTPRQLALDWQTPVQKGKPERDLVID